jgi:hypothetical protein
MKRFGIIAALIVILMGLTVKASAQFGETPNLRGKMIYGGNFGFGIRGNQLNFSISPQVGYRVFNPWEIGVRGTYNLLCYFNRYAANDYFHYVGVAPYTNFEIFSGIFLHVEDEIVYGFGRWNGSNIIPTWYNSVFVGGGYRQYTYNGSYAYFMVLYNLSWGVLSNAGNGGMETPYSSPFSFRVGYCF